MSNARAYIRVSSERQSLGASLDTQRDAIRQYADAHGLTLVHEYCDILSGTRDDRPRYTQLLADLQPGEVVLVWRLDRVGRKKSELFRFFEWCKQHRIALVSITQPEMSNELARDIMSVIAAFESQQIAERVLPNMTARAIEGRWVSRVPRWFAIGENGHLTPAADYEDAERAFALFLTTGNLVATAAAFETTTKTMTRHFRNRAYLGESRWSDISVKGAHPAIVSAPLWGAVNSLLDARLRGERRSRPDSPLLTGYLFVGGTNRRLYRQPDVRRNNHRYATRGDGSPGSRYSVRCDVADAWVVTQLASLTLTRADRAVLLRDVREAARDDPHKAARARLLRQQAALERERDGTAAMLARGQIDHARWERLDRRQGNDLAQIAAQLAALPPVIEPAHAAALATLRIDLAARVHAAWQAGNVAALRLLLEAFVERVEVWVEPSDGLRGKARGFWPDHPARFAITWISAGMVAEERQLGT
ncbi:MAG: recombinase family protein [Thermomicrobia bacterium]|nr:recombinase family protein [Thermomicrobia bacterium]